ncbi:MAG: DUF4189 domain-containing protein [Pseudomonadota bacterium]
MKRLFAYPFCAMLVLAAAPAYAVWGAVVVNEKTGDFGYTNKWKTQSEAVQRATENCERYSEGVAGCRVRLITRQCFAVSYVGRNAYVSEARTKSAASQQAKAACTANHGAACSEIGRHVHCAAK